MKKCLQFSLLVLFTAFVVGCKSYSIFPIDKYGTVKVDANLVGIWKMKEDTDFHNYFVIERADDNNYAVTYMNRSGANRGYENYRVFVSEVGGAKFFNVSYANVDFSTGPGKLEEEGFFFLKVVSIDSKGFDMTLQLVADSTLKFIKDPQQVRERVLKNVDNPDFYAKPVHFRKILPLMYCK